MYVAYTAPHWPLHALQPDIDDYEGVYDQGWDALRDQRLLGLKAEKILPEDSSLSPRDPAQPVWDSAPHKAWESRRMQVYAAQVQALDRGVGQILQALEEAGQRENTLVIFLSDNGASAETLPNTTAEALKARSDIFPGKTRDGREIHLGNTPTIHPGAEDIYSSYGQAWANLSNTPHRLYKRWLHEGGISTPFIMNWPRGGLDTGLVSHEPFQLIDIVPTILEITGATYPEAYPGREPLPLEGRSMLPAMKGEPVEEVALFWEHIGNAAVRRGLWKLVREYGKPWELYDVAADRAEEHDLSGQQPELAQELERLWQEWADWIGVIPFDVTVQLYAERGLSREEAQS
jgi:arylsulfatase